MNIRMGTNVKEESEMLSNERKRIKRTNKEDKGKKKQSNIGKRRKKKQKSGTSMRLRSNIIRCNNQCPRMVGVHAKMM